MKGRHGGTLVCHLPQDLKVPDSNPVSICLYLNLKHEDLDCSATTAGYVKLLY